jgi:hypothetical protein
MLSGFASFAATAARHDLEALYLVAYLFVVGGVGEEHQAVSTGVWVGRASRSGARSVSSPGPSKWIPQSWSETSSFVPAPSVAFV